MLSIPSVSLITRLCRTHNLLQFLWFVRLCAPLIFSTLSYFRHSHFSGVPGHRGMQENEVVDQLANVALTGSVPNCSSLAMLLIFRYRLPGVLKASEHLFSSRDCDHLRNIWRLDLCHSSNTAVIFTRLRRGVPSFNFYLHSRAANCVHTSTLRAP